jgi:hypothetical protein
MNRDRWTTTLEKIKGWLRHRQLAREIRNSENFQKECEKMHCFHLAELEGKHRAELQEEIQQLNQPPRCEEDKSSP